MLDGARSPGRIVRYTWTNVTQKTRVVTTEPRLTVKEPLAPGRYQFQLVVTDETGSESKAAAANVVVTPPRRRRASVPLSRTRRMCTPGAHGVDRPTASPTAPGRTAGIAV